MECIISHHLPQSLGGPYFFLGTAEVRQTFKEIQHREEAATSCNGGRGTPRSPTHTYTHSASEAAILLLLRFVEGDGRRLS